MTEQWMLALAGGAIIGGAASLLLIFNGRVSGISGIFHRAMSSNSSDDFWRLKFILGIIVGGFLSYELLDINYSYEKLGILELSISGFLVGLGTKLANGCTSGHGVCGISRLSLRSLVATIVFISKRYYFYVCNQNFSRS